MIRTDTHLPLSDERAIKLITDWGIFLDDDGKEESKSYRTVGAFRFEVRPIPFSQNSCFAGGPNRMTVLEKISSFQLQERLAELTPLVMRSVLSEDCKCCYSCIGMRPAGVSDWVSKCGSPRYLVCSVNDILIDLYASILEKNRIVEASSLKEQPKQQPKQPKQPKQLSSSDQESVPKESKPILKEKKKTISLLMKRRVWVKYIGEDVGKAKCLCCNMSDITQMSFHCGHVLSENNGGPTALDNLLPICQSCNSSMGTRDLMEYKRTNGL
jgi:5-methylcytosine-specific restriction endonuclease McrA